MFITFQKGVSKRRTLAVFYLEKPERKDPPIHEGVAAGVTRPRARRSGW